MWKPDDPINWALGLILDAIAWLVPGRAGRILSLLVCWAMFLVAYVLYSR